MNFTWKKQIRVQWLCCIVRLHSLDYIHVWQHIIHNIHNYLKANTGTEPSPCIMFQMSHDVLYICSNLKVLPVFSVCQGTPCYVRFVSPNHWLQFYTLTKTHHVNADPCVCQSATVNMTPVHSRTFICHTHRKYADINITYV